MIKIRDLWLGGIQGWLNGYSAYIRAESRSPRRSVYSALDFFAFITGDAQEIRFPGMDAMDLLKDRVQRDWAILPTQEEIASLSQFNAFHEKLARTKSQDIAEGKLPEESTPWPI